MGVRWLICNVRKGTRWLYRGYTWQRLVQSSVQSFEGAPCRAPPKALPEASSEALHEALPEALQKALPEPLHKALPEALYEAPSKLYTELYTELYQSFTALCTTSFHPPFSECSKILNSVRASDLALIATS